MTEDSFAIDTQYGRVRGFDKNGVRTWLGIPYARAARFEAPQAAEPWSGVRDAVSPAPMCPQGFGGRRPKVPEGVAEDCLTVNIWAPPADGRRRPVMFWIHGGAFMAGGANQYDGQEFARLHDIVVVGINYRVGVLGFVNFGDALGLPSIPSNLGLRDQIAALRWVHDNVGAFGGDPTRVTIVGQSAGSMSVSLLMLCKEAWPYFRGAVLQSGALNLLHDREKSIFVARGYAEKLGLNQGSLDKLRALDVNALLDAQGEVQKLTPNGIPASPWYDGELLPDSYIAAQAAPVAQVPIMAGATRQEVRLFDLLPGPRILPTRRADIEPLLRHQLPQKAEAILWSYPKSSTGQIDLASDLTFFMPTRNFAERHARTQPAWFYRFDYAHPIAGATHGLDLTFMWPMSGIKAALARGGWMSGRRAALAQRMRAHVAAFVREADPGADWPRFEAPRFATKIYALTDSVVDDPDADRRRAWGGEDASPGATLPAA